MRITLTGSVGWKSIVIDLIGYNVNNSILHNINYRLFMRISAQLAD
jgi:hypothetical protein